MIRIGGSLLRIKREDAIYYTGEHHSSYLKQVFQRCPRFNSSFATKQLLTLAEALKIKRKNEVLGKTAS